MYYNPIHIIPLAKFEDLNAFKLQNIRAKLLEDIALSDLGTIKIKSRNYDREAILNIFEDLEISDIPFHIRVFKHTMFQSFLESGKLDFFEQKHEWKILENTEFRNWVKPFFVQQLSEVFYQTILQKNIVPFQLLEASSFQLPKDWEILVFTKSIKLLHQWMDGIERRFEVPTLAVSPSKLRPEIAPELDNFYMDMFEMFPEAHFDNLRYRYGAWSHEVLRKVLGNDEKIENIDKETLKLLKVAASNASKVLLPKANQQIAEDIESYLRDGFIKKKKEKTSSNMNGLVVLGIICFSLFLIAQISDYSIKEMRKQKTEHWLKTDIAKTIKKERIKKLRTKFNFLNMKRLESSGDTTIPYYKMEVRVGKFSDIYTVEDQLRETYKKYAKHDISKTTHLWLRVLNPYQIAREYSITIHPYPPGELTFKFYREPISDEKILTIKAANNYRMNYELFGEIHEELEGITNFSGEINSYQDTSTLKYNIRHQRRNSSATVNLLELKSSDFLFKTEKDSRYKKPINVRAALANYFAIQGLNISQRQKPKQKVTICGGLSRGTFDLEEGFIKWEDSPYSNIYQLRVRTKNFVVNYFVNQKTGVIEQMEMLNNKSGKYSRTVIFCRFNM